MSKIITRRFDVAISAAAGVAVKPLPQGNSDEFWTEALENEIRAAIKSAIEDGYVGGYVRKGDLFDFELAPAATDAERELMQANGMSLAEVRLHYGHG